MAEPAIAETPIQTESLSVVFGELRALDDVTLAVRSGEAFAIMGPSGCGKSTLLRCLVGLQAPTSGVVRLEGRDLADMDHAELAAQRARTGLVFQGGALLNSLSLFENIALPMRLCTDLPRAAVDEAVRMLLAQVGLLKAQERLPSQLSGGMRKRAGIARALALEPELLLLDEPTAGLDPLSADGIDRLLVELRETLDVTLVMVTHDLDSAQKVCERVLMLHEGRALCEGDWDALRASEDALVRSFLARESRGAQRGTARLLAGEEAA